MKIGANLIKGNKCEFTVWAPYSENVELEIVSPDKKTIPMERMNNGYWNVSIDDIHPKTKYFYKLGEDILRPDPASSYQPDTVHQASQVIDHSKYNWTDDDWQGIDLSEMIIYEIHTGTFTPEGTFEAIIHRLPELADTGINAIELMPVAQFPGSRNWGYDGVYPFAVQNSYGGPAGLKNLVNACHNAGIVVILDVVCNHIGPEGSYPEDFAPYFTDKYGTPWGKAMNFDDKYNEGVRNFFIENALHWFENYHIDALRLDALHAIYDASAKPFIQELAETVESYSEHKKRKYFLIGETNRNDRKLILERNKGGYGLDAQWCDDFHHSLHALLTGEKEGYYIDFGKVSHLAKACDEGFVLDWKYSEYRKKRHGSSSIGIPSERFIISSQTHDQTGNRLFGDRLPALVSFEALKLAAGAVLLSPYVPMLFMGEEYGETNPFQYFISHTEEELINAVREGRKRDFKAFDWDEEPPDPQDHDTFFRSKIDWQKRSLSNGKILLQFYKKLISLRKELFGSAKRGRMKSIAGDEKRILTVYRNTNNIEIFFAMNFNDRNIHYAPNLLSKKWEKILDSASEEWNGPGESAPINLEDEEKILIRSWNFVLYKANSA